MDIFPQGVRVVIGETQADNKVLNLETGEQITGIKGICLEYDAANPDATQLILIVHPRKFEVESVDGKFEVDERALRRVAEQNGFKLVPLDLEQKDLEPLGTAPAEQVATSATAVGAPVTGRDKPADLGGDDVDGLDAGLTDEEDDEA